VAILIILFWLVLFAPYLEDYFSYPSHKMQQPVTEKAKTLCDDYLSHPSRKIQQPVTTKSLSDDMEIVIRLTVTEKFVNRIFCDVLRSSTVMWNSTLLGNFLFILSESDRAVKGPHLLQSLSALDTVHRFRAVYQKEPNNKTIFLKESQRQNLEYGYMLQMYSSFIMDMYMTKPIIAWLDTDAIFSMPASSR